MISLSNELFGLAAYVLDLDFAALVFGVLAACGRAGRAQGRAQKQSGWSNVEAVRMMKLQMCNNVSSANSW
ncbi:hypothetical protein [Comamonas jiangduensis]|uniref:hypothetical protein n=1 Tax=Comamonas jiangduensis TaxID=1194168 RepID=UPI003BF78CA2